MRTVLALLIAMGSCGCGGQPPQPGVHTRLAPYTGERVGAAPAAASGEEFAEGWSMRYQREGDLLGDSAPERVVELPLGTGVEIWSGTGAILGRIASPGTLTDFGILREHDRPKADLVLYVYPNHMGGGTFQVVDAAGRERARWQEMPPPSRFAIATWRGAPAVFYLQRTRIVIRSPSGARLASLAAPHGSSFSRLFVASLGDGRAAVVGSGGGYTPYHFVAVYHEDEGRLLFEEVAPEHAFGLEADPLGRSFIVSTRTSRIRYRPDSVP